MALYFDFYLLDASYFHLGKQSGKKKSLPGFDLINFYLTLILIEGHYSRVHGLVIASN
jgi:hypothetical protein